MRIWLVEITGHDGTGEVVHRLASAGYVTRPSDTPANTHYRPHVIEPGDYDRYAFGPGRTRGRSSANPGEIVLANPDGALDDLRGQGFSGRSVRILTVEHDAAYATAAVRFVGTMLRPEWTWQRVTFRIRDKAELFEVPACPALFEGDAVGPVATSSFVALADLDDLDPAATFERASAAEHIDGGVRTTFASGVPRLLTTGIELEAGTTNLFTAPEDLSNAAWAKTSGDSAALVGDVSEFTEGTGTGSHGWGQNLGTLSGVCSAFEDLEYVSQRWYRAYLWRASAHGGLVWFDLLTGTVGTESNLGGGTGTEGEMIPLGAGKYRCIIRTNVGGSGTVALAVRGSTGDGSTATYTGAGAVVVKVHRQQGESGAGSSYVVGTRPDEDLTLAVPDGSYDILLGWTSGREWDDAVTVSGGGGYTVPLQASADTLADIQFYAAGALTSEDKTLLEVGGIGGGLGGAADLAGTRKPRVYGTVMQIQPTLLNPFSLIYGVAWDDDGERSPVDVITAVYDRGAALTFGSDHATAADLLTATVAAGEYDTCVAEGLFRLGSPAVGTVTADVTEGDDAADRTAAQIMDRLAQGPGGLTSGEVDAAAIAALDTANDAELGLWLTGETTVAEALDALAATVGAYWTFDRLGVFQTRRVVAPAGTPVATLLPSELLDRGQAIEIVPSADEGDGVPYWRVTVRYSRAWTVQPRDNLALGLTEERKAYLSQEWRSAVDDDESVLTKHLRAPELLVDSLFVHEADALAEATRLLALFGTARDRFRVVAPEAKAGTVDLGDVVALKAPRLGLAAGKSFLALGVGRQASRSTVTLELWG